MESEAEFPGSLRPSRFRRVQAGALGWASVVLIDYGDADARVLRDMLGVLGLEIVYMKAGQPRHLVEAFTRVTSDVDYVVLAGHGDDAGLIISDDLPEQIAQNEPFRRRLTPDLVREHVQLTGQTVIANGCQAGDTGLADAFLASGAGNYVGSTGSPFGYASILAPVLVFYELVSKRTLPEAVTKLQSIDEASHLVPVPSWPQ